MWIEYRSRKPSEWNLWEEEEGKMASPWVSVRHVIFCDREMFWYLKESCVCGDGEDGCFPEPGVSQMEMGQIEKERGKIDKWKSVEAVLLIRSGRWAAIFFILWGLMDIHTICRSKLEIGYSFFNIS